jgi:hypothetical protein
MSPRRLRGRNAATHLAFSCEIRASGISSSVRVCLRID